MERKPGSLTKPLWTEEFSVHASEDAYVLRRQFMKFLVLTSFGMFVGNTWIWMRSLFAGNARGTTDDNFPLAYHVANSADVPRGGVRLFNYPGPNDPCILVRTRDGQLAAYSQKCTHLSCAVYYSAEKNRLECPCHEGYFSIEDGRVLQGPPPRPLPRLNVYERDGRIFATGVDVAGGDHR